MVGSSNSGVYVIGNYVYINGKRLPPPPNQDRNKNCRTKQVVSVSNNHVFINGYEYKNGKWKKTLRALWHWWF